MWTFYALSTIKMERFFKWGEIWFGRERSYFKRNFFIYVNFSGCKTNKCAECWHVANWKKRRTHYSGETTLERPPLGEITDSMPFCPEILILAIQNFYWKIIDRSAKESPCARFESVWWSGRVSPLILETSCQFRVAAAYSCREWNHNSSVV